MLFGVFLSRIFAYLRPNKIYQYSVVEDFSLLNFYFLVRTKFNKNYHFLAMQCFLVVHSFILWGVFIEGHVGFELMPIIANDPKAPKNLAHFKSGLSLPPKVT